MFKKLSSGWKRARGQSFVELGLSLLFLLTLLAVVIDLGWAFYTMVALRDVAQEAAAFGAMCPDEPALIEERLRQSASAPIRMEDLEGGNVEICIVDSTPADHPALFECDAADNEDPERGNSVRIAVRIQHQILVPFVGGFIGTQTYPLTATSTNTILVEECATD